MIRRRNRLFAVCAVLLIPQGAAQAQWGYGGWGWGGGWGGGGATIQGSELQGAAQFAMGAGQYNLSTAQANSINAQTAMMWNDYVAQVTHESAKLHAMKVHSEFQKNQRLYDEHKKRLRENPGRYEIENGDALNAILEDLTNPKIGSAAMYAAKAKIPASLIADVPFQNSSERVTLMLDGLREAVKWPDVFEGERFVEARKTFDEIRAKLREEAATGEISAKSLRTAQSYVDSLRARITAQPLPDPLDQKEATRFLSACSSLLGLLRKPDIQPAIVALRQVQDTTAANLLGFMNAFNLRFGVAKSLKEKQAYQRLFAILDPVRDQILGELKGGEIAQAQLNPSQAAEFLNGVNTPGGTTPQPPQAGNPK